MESLNVEKLYYFFTSKYDSLIKRVVDESY